MRNTVVGLFDSKDDARAAINELVEHGFIKKDIDLSNRRIAGGNEPTEDKGQGLGDRISNFFSSLFGSDTDTARNYTNAATEAEAILTVQVDSRQRANEAQEIFDRHDAMDVDERTAQYGRQAAAGDTAGVRGRETKDRTIPVVEERLDVGKRQVESGGARIRSRIVEKPVEEHIRLREEHVVVNRRPVDREVTEADMKNFKPGEMEITERAEVPVVGKEARVIEEVEVSKNVTERDETVRDKVRKTDVKVQRFDRDDRGRKNPPQPRV